MTSRLLGLSMVVMGTLLSGCASVSTMGLARTLNQGAVQGWVAPEGGGVVAVTGTIAGATGVGYPLLEGGIRVGVTDRFELGARLGLSGVGLEGKIGFLRSPTMDTGINLSLNPGVTYVGFGLGSAFVGTLTFHLPLLIGIDFGGHELVLGPRFIDQLVFAGTSGTGSSASSAGINIIYAGGSVGFAIKAGPNLRILPEVSIGVPVVATGTVGTSSATAVGAGGLIFQAGVAFLFGTSNAYDPPEALPTPPPPPAPANAPLPPEPAPAPIMPPPPAPTP
ncbi:MAG: hypothetical protein Q8L48_37930 [Archangium sp.]|nr:hypothetical protein [Archangium sp.]